MHCIPVRCVTFIFSLPIRFSQIYCFFFHCISIENLSRIERKFYALERISLTITSALPSHPQFLSRSFANGLEIVDLA